MNVDIYIFQISQIRVKIVYIKYQLHLSMEYLKVIFNQTIQNDIFEHSRIIGLISLKHIFSISWYHCFMVGVVAMY